MKKCFVIIVLFLCLTTAQGQEAGYLDLRERTFSKCAPSGSTPSCEVLYTEDYVEIAYSFGAISLKPDDAIAGSYHVGFEGFGVEDEDCRPSIPVRCDRIALPPGAMPTIEIVKADMVDFALKVAPALSARHLSFPELYPRVMEIEPDSAYETSRFVDGLVIEKSHNTSFALVGVHPVLYDTDRKSVRVCRELVYRINFNHSDNTHHRLASDYSGVSQSMSMASSGVLNNTVPDTIASCRDITQDMLVISSSICTPAARRFADLKRLMGYRVRLEIRDVWTSELIDSVSKAAYRELDDLAYIILIGGVKDVPPVCVDNELFSGFIQKGERLFSDYPYACMDGDDDMVADVYISRIITRDSKDYSAGHELNNSNAMVDRIVKYELLADMDSLNYKRAIHVSIFEPDTVSIKLPNKVEYEYREFVRTSEDILNHVQSNGVKIMRGYSKWPKAQPKYWHNKELMPDILQYPSDVWNGTPELISNYIEEGCLYVMNTGHGDRTGWGRTHIPGKAFYTGRDLINVSLPDNNTPLIFCNCCLNGFLDQYRDVYGNYQLTITNRWLNYLKKGGAIGVYAASASSYTPDNNYIFSGIFNAIWKTPDFYVGNPIYPSDKVDDGREKCRSLGQYLEYGIERMKRYKSPNSILAQYQTLVYHCFGDASMEFRTAYPKPYEGLYNISSSNSGTKLVVEAMSGFSPCVSYINHKTGMSGRYCGNDIEINVGDMGDISYVVTDSDLKPNLVRKPGLYIQNVQVDNTLRLSESAAIIIGSETDILNVYGDVKVTSGHMEIEGESLEIHPGVYIDENSTFKFNKI